ncbi:hypothetical protein cyc_07430 [Cyclospora cayetanensis]|uniref:Uncharacterized protein n=1 Tax=Cyclospora cayetanensis TaxID=88456 RepID=A0A1D3CYN4_9EIME|nr:hypothetical protein cyc_07430 [Cyclospora cayetanensis]
MKQGATTPPLFSPPPAPSAAAVPAACAQQEQNQGGRKTETSPRAAATSEVLSRVTAKEILLPAEERPPLQTPLQKGQQSKEESSRHQRTEKAKQHAFSSLADANSVSLSDGTARQDAESAGDEWAADPSCSDTEGEESLLPFFTRQQQRPSATSTPAETAGNPSVSEKAVIPTS